MNSDFVNKALDQAKALQKTVVDAISKSAEQAHPLLDEAVTRANALRETLVQSAANATFRWARALWRPASPKRTSNSNRSPNKFGKRSSRRLKLWGRNLRTRLQKRMRIRSELLRGRRVAREAP
jgi:hypothetical protein